MSYGLSTTYPEVQQESAEALQELSYTLRGLQPNTSYSFQVFPVPAESGGVGLEQGGEVPGTGLITVWTQVGMELFRLLPIVHSYSVKGLIQDF